MLSNSVPNRGFPTAAQSLKEKIVDTFNILGSMTHQNLQKSDFLVYKCINYYKVPLQYFTILVYTV